MTGELFDPGLQPERTELAWRRTTLSLIVGALIALRLLPAALGPWALAAGLVGFVLAALLWVLARRRAHQIRYALLDSDGGTLPGGGPLLIVSALTAAGAALGLLYATLS